MILKGYIKMELLVTKKMLEMVNRWKNGNFNQKLQVEREWEGLGYTMYELTILTQNED